MKRIASFNVDHTKLKEGIYTSRTDDDIITYDIRMVRPNCGEYISYAALHTFEHLFATYARNSRFESHIIYVGPMGCRTGFYFLVRNMNPADTIALVQESFAFIADFAGEIPGTAEAECGNYREHDLPGARDVAIRMVKALDGWTTTQLQYEQ